MPEPIAVIGGAALLLMMLMGKKKPGKVGPLKPGDKPTPLPPGTKKGPSDDLPPGSKGGHLPKNKGYRPPDDMTTTDIWVSPDCQAYLVGAEWYPTFEDQDAYTSFMAAYGPDNADDPRVQEWVEVISAVFLQALQEADKAGRDFIIYDGQRYEPNLWDFPGYLIGYFPTGIYSPADAFTLGVLTEVAPLCADTVPMFQDFDAEDEWSDAYDTWVDRYPAIDDLMKIIRDEATVGELPEGQNVALPRTPGDSPTSYVGARNMKNAWSDSIGAVGGFEVEGG
jgi:hypothetical protein